MFIRECLDNLNFIVLHYDTKNIKFLAIYKCLLLLLMDHNYPLVWVISHKIFLKWKSFMFILVHLMTSSLPFEQGAPQFRLPLDRQMTKPALASDHEFKVRPISMPVGFFQPHLAVWRAVISKAGVVPGRCHELERDKFVANI